MVFRYSGNILLQCEVTEEGLLVKQFNGLPSKTFRRFLEDFDGNLFTSKNVKVGMDNAKLGDEVEILAKLSYKEHHCQITDTHLYFYKIRKPKCVNGLKKCSVSFKRVAEECFHKKEI